MKKPDKENLAGLFSDLQHSTTEESPQVLFHSKKNQSKFTLINVAMPKSGPLLRYLPFSKPTPNSNRNILNRLSKE